MICFGMKRLTKLSSRLMWLSMYNCARKQFAWSWNSTSVAFIYFINELKVSVGRSEICYIIQIMTTKTCVSTSTNHIMENPQFDYKDTQFTYEFPHAIYLSPHTQRITLTSFGNPWLSLAGYLHTQWMSIVQYKFHEAFDFDARHQ